MVCLLSTIDGPQGTVAGSDHSHYTDERPLKNQFSRRDREGGRKLFLGTTSLG